MIAGKATCFEPYTSLTLKNQKNVYFGQSNQRSSSRNKIFQFSKSTYKTYIIKKLRKSNKKRLNQQKKLIKVLNENSSQLLQVNDYTCPICLQVMVNPIVFECGHFGCMKCIETGSIYQNKCFLCRQTLSNLQYNPSKIIQNIINSIIIKNTQNIIQYYTRSFDHFKWQQNKKIDINAIELGNLIDVKCQETGRWKVGCVMDIVQVQNNNLSFLIKYTGSQGTTKQFIQSSSSRLAKVGFFTQKKTFQPIQNVNIQRQVEIPQIVNDFSMPNPSSISSDDQSYFEKQEEEQAKYKVLDPIEVGSLEQKDIYSLQIQQYLNPSFYQSFSCLGNELLEQIQL